MSAIAATSVASRPHLRRLAWLHPEWWALVLCAIAWLAMLRPHAHHMDPAQAWLLMTLAMMLPLVIGPIRFTAERSLWRRRHRAIAGFLAGYVAWWMLVGVVVSFVTPGRYAAAIAFAAAGAWQLTRWKRVALVACHRVMPLAPRGWRADRDCIRYGWSAGTRCVVSCWAVMAACALTGHSLPVMAGLCVIAYIERCTRRPDHRLLSAALFAAAIVVLRLG